MGQWDALDQRTYHDGPLAGLCLAFRHVCERSRVCPNQGWVTQTQEKKEELQRGSLAVYISTAHGWAPGLAGRRLGSRGRSGGLI